MRTHLPFPRARRVVAGLVASLAVAAVPAAVARADTANDHSQFSVTPGTLAFETAPDVPDLPGVTLNGQAQTVTTQMNDYSVDDATGSGAGWNVTVSGDNSAGKSPVFAQYCPNPTCGSDSQGYVSGGFTMAADSLSLDSTGASFTGLHGTTGTAPTQQCNSGCALDASPSSPVKVASAAVGAGMGTWSTLGFGGSSLSLAVPTTLRALPDPAEVYRVDLVWTLQSAP